MGHEIASRGKRYVQIYGYVRFIPTAASCDLSLCNYTLQKNINLLTIFIKCNLFVPLGYKHLNFFSTHPNCPKTKINNLGCGCQSQALPGISLVFNECLKTDCSSNYFKYSSRMNSPVNSNTTASI